MRIIIAALATLMASSATASEEEAKFGRYVLTAFQCFSYASNAQDQPEMERFFGIGLNASRKFLEALRSNRITADEVSKFVPMSVVWSSQGPTVDFAAGRIFGVVTTDSYDKMAKYDSTGMLLPIDKWITNKSLLKSIGERAYRDSNCELIK